VYLQEKFPVEQLIDRNILDNEPVKPPALDDTPFTFVDDLKTLEVLATKLKSAIEFAVSSFISTSSAMSFFISLLVSC
jgi:exosome complex exonuclease RRP6